MPKLNKPSVRFAFIKKRRFPFQTVRLCLTYKGKRLYQTDEGNNWYGIDLSQFNSDGTLTLNDDNPEKEAYMNESKRLLYMAESATKIAEEAEKRGVWELLTSKDFADLLNYLGEYRPIAERKCNGKLNDFEKAVKMTYEFCWQRIGKRKV